MSERVGRRAILGSAIGLAVPALAVAQTTPSAPFTAGPKGLTVVYVAAWDCPPCNEWKKNYKAEFEASPQYKRLTFRLIDSPAIKAAYDETYWPEDLRSLRTYLLEKKWRGVPRFVFLRDGKIVSTEHGVDGWKYTVWPSIQKTIKT